MSAFICTNDTIAAIALTICGADASADSIATTGRLLIAENVRAVNFRYNETEEATFELADADLDTLRGLAPERIAGAVRCYTYQISETPDYATTPAAILAGVAFDNAKRAWVAAGRRSLTAVANFSGEGWDI